MIEIWKDTWINPQYVVAVQSEFLGVNVHLAGLTQPLVMGFQSKEENSRKAKELVALIEETVSPREPSEKNS